MIQGSLLAQSYTSLHNYCQAVKLPSPPPSVEEVADVWTQDFRPIQQEVERITVIARGKAVHQPFSQGGDTRKSTTGLNIRNKVSDVRRPGAQSTQSTSSELPRVSRVTSNQSATSASENLPRVSRISSNQSTPPANENRPRTATSRISSGGSPASETPPRINRMPSSQNMQASRITSKPPMPSPSLSPYLAPTQSSSRLAPRASSSNIRPSTSAGGSAAGDSYFTRQPSSNNLSAAAAAAGTKKKPPPPPPKKRIGTQPPAIYVVASFPFAGQGQGDLAFEEGDRIKVIKKTDSTDDWWEGECGGRKGSFPANYCREV